MSKFLDKIEAKLLGWGVHPTMSRKLAWVVVGVPVFAVVMSVWRLFG